MTKCRVCKRPLKREPWRTLGIGKVCSTKTGYKDPELKFETDDVTVPYDGGVIFIERRDALTLNQNQPVENAADRYTMQKHSASGIRTNVPAIKRLHSPTGFNFGYPGSGPADFALNVMLMFCENSEAAHRLHQTFKSEFVAVNCGDRLEIEPGDIVSFIASHGAEVKPQFKAENV